MCMILKTEKHTDERVLKKVKMHLAPNKVTRKFHTFVMIFC